MMRNELLKYLHSQGCDLLREGGKHSWWHNPAQNKRSAIPRHSEILQVNDLLEALAYFAKERVGEFLQRMRLGPACPPVERFWLMAKNIAGFVLFASTFGGTNSYRKRVVVVVFRGSHRQAYHQRGLIVEVAGRKYQKGMNIAHLLPGLGVAVNPDNILAIGHPGSVTGDFGGVYHFSAPTG